MNRAVLWSAVERALPRVTSAIILVIFAALAAPAVVGLYFTATLAVTFLQSSFDLSMRQYAVGLVGDQRGLRIIRRFQIVYLSCGAALVLFVLTAIFFSEPAQGLNVAGLLPLALVPVFGALAIRAVATLQKANRWRRLARFQALATLFGICVGLPALVLTGSPLGPALSAATAEGVFTIAAIVGSRRVAAAVRIDEESDASALQGFAAVSATSVVTWFQLNLDRLLIVMLAGPALLGLYAVAWAVARSAADAVVAASANVLRPALFMLQDSNVPGSESVRFDSVMKTSASIVFAGGVAIIVGAKFAQPLFLDPSWDDAIDAIPVVVALTVPSLVEALLGVVLVTRRKGNRLLPVKVVSVVLAIPIGFAATLGLEIAAWVAVGRQVVTLVAMIAITPGVISRSSGVLISLLIAAQLSCAAALGLI